MTDNRFMLTLTMFTLLISVTKVQAYTTRTQNGCNPITFASPPRVVLHTSEAVGFSDSALQNLMDAMVDIHARVNSVGATTAGITSFSVSPEPFVYMAWFGDLEPTIHVGFTTDSSANPGGTFWDVDGGTCNIREAHIQFQDPSVFSWAFSTPSYYGDDYYSAELTTVPNAGGIYDNNLPASGGSIGTGLQSARSFLEEHRYFRISYVHELLHAFGLSHSADSYSMLNYGHRPWANRGINDQVSPLPDDVEGLRALYPADGFRAEVAVLNTWYDASALSNGTYPAASQERLCQPSLGDSWASEFNSTCGISAGQDGWTTVSEGDNLRTRVAVANYGTESVTVDERMYFSSDGIYDVSDVESPTVRSFSVSQNGSTKQGRLFSVPALQSGTYHVIAHITATTASGITVTDWIPLRGTIDVP